MKRIVADLQQTETPFAAAERYSTVKTLTLSRIPIFHNPDLQLSSVPPVVITTINRKAPRELVVSPFNEKAKQTTAHFRSETAAATKTQIRAEEEKRVQLMFSAALGLLSLSSGDLLQHVNTLSPP